MLAQRNRLALELAGEAAEVAQDVARTLCLGAGLRADGIASLLGDDPRELLHPRLDGICNLLQHTATLSRNDAAPACEGFTRSPHGPVDVFGAAARNAANVLAVPGRFYRYFLPGGAVDPASVYQHLRALARSGRGCLAHRHCHRCILLQSSSLAPD